jgi:TM2 domain
MQTTPAAAPPSEPYRSKTLATWLALVGGTLGLHRFYLHGFKDAWGWLAPIPTALGLYGLERLQTIGVEDFPGSVLVTLLGLSLAGAMLQAIVIGLTPDERWHPRFNPALASQPDAPGSGWGAVLGVAVSLLVGATILMSTIAFAGQRYFEHQIEEAHKLSQ